MAFVSTSTDFLFLNTATRSGRLFLPSTVDNQGRILTFKDIVGTFGQSTVTISTLGRSQSFEDGTNTRVLSDAFGSYSFLASSTIWYTLGGTQINQGIYSTLQAQTVSSRVVNTSSIFTFSTILTEGLTRSTNTLYQRSTLLYFQSNVLGGAKVGVPLFLSNRAFTPRSVSGLALWLDSSDIASLVIADDRLAQWNDKSGNTRNFAQATATDRPSFGTFLSYPGIRFLNSSLSNNYIQTGRGGRQSFIVFFDLNSVNKTLFNMASGNSVIGGSWSPGFDNQRLELNVAVAYDLQEPAIPTLLDQASGVSRRVIGLWGMSTNATLSSAYTYGNGIPGSTGTTFNALTTQISTANSTPTTLGSNTYLVISEVLHYSTEPSAAQRQQIEGYLAWKWGVVQDLPSDHPYKNVPP